MNGETSRDGIERLALVLADEDLYDFLVGDRWMGWPNDENDDEVRDYIESVLPRCRERAQRYADLLDPPVERCQTCIHPEGYDRLSGPCPTCNGDGVIPPEENK